MTSDLDFTPEERAALRRWHAQYDKPYRFGYYVALLVPMVLFAVYGIVKRDVIAISIAFAGVLIYHTCAIADYVSRAPQYRSLLTKIVRREFGDERP